MAELSENILAVFTVVGMLVALIGAFMPILPGSIIAWISLLAYSLATGWSDFGYAWFGGMSVLLVVTGSAEWWLPLLGAKATGASKRSLLFGIVGALLGLFLFPPFGSIIGYALGVLIGSYVEHRDLQMAFKASLGNLAGQGVAAIVELVGILIVLGLFIWLVF